MAKTRTVKETSVARVTEKLKQGKGIVFADFTGLLVKEMQELRAELRKAGIYFEVVKKTLLKRGLADAGLSDISLDNITGSISVAVSEDDEIVSAKTLVDFAKKHDKLQVLGGVMESKFIDDGKVKSLAQLPSKPELLGKLVGSINAPLSGLVGVLQGNLRGLVQVLRAASQKQS